MYCPNCGKQTNGSPYCPSCGQAVASTPVVNNGSIPTPKKSHTVRNVLLSILGIFVFFGIIRAFIPDTPSSSSGSSGSPASSSASEPAPSYELAVSATTLWQRYQANEVAADNSYKGKKLLVTGTVARIAKDFTDSPYVELATPNEFEDIQAHLKDEKGAARLQIGQKVSMICKGNGMIIASPMLDDCEFYIAPTTASTPLSTEVATQPSDAPPPAPPGVTSQPTPELENEPLQQVPADPASSSNPGFRTYSNERFGFRIDYPQSFIAGRPPENGDGMEFTSSDGKATLNVSGGNNAGWTLREYYSMSIKDIHGKVGYQTFGDGWFVVTWTEGDKLGYRKMFVGNGSENSFTFIYPIGQRTLYDEVVTKMEKSFRPGNVQISS